MFGKKCSLCGGRLDERGICTDCGLDNGRQNKRYRLNGVDHNHVPIQDAKNWQEQVRKQTTEKENKLFSKESIQTYTPVKSDETGWNSGKIKTKKKKQKNKIPGRKIFLIIVIVAMIWMVFSSEIENLQTTIQDMFYDTVGNDSEYNPYEYVTREIPEEGETASYTLTSGNYIVGVHIPEGIYTAEAQSVYDSVHVEDYENSIYFYDSADESNYELEDIRLYKGVLINISCEKTMTLSSDNAQNLDAVGGLENPLTQKAEFKMTEGSEIVAGQDMEAGIYDLKVLDGEGSIYISVLDDNQDEIYSTYLYLGLSQIDGTEYQYVVLSEGSSITAEDDMQLELTPSKIIESTDYREFYQKYN